MEEREVRGALEAGWPELASMLQEHDADPVNGGLSYLEMAAITRFLADKLRSGETGRFPTFFQAAERCLLEGNDEAITLVTVGLFEDLQNANITELENDVWVPFLGPRSRRAWRAVENFWNGDVEAISRFSVEPHEGFRQSGLVVGAGLATGVLTQLGQSVLPDGWSQFANAISPWLLVAFLVGWRLDPLRAAIGGIGTLAFALIGYDAMILLRFGYGPSFSSSVFWGIGAVVGGPVFGVAGRAWRAGTHRQRAAALGLLVAVAVAEGIYHAVILDEPAVGSRFVVAGLLLPLILGRSRDDRLGAYVAAVPALGLGALGYVAFAWLNGLTTGT